MWVRLALLLGVPLIKLATKKIKQRRKKHKEQEAELAAHLDGNLGELLK